MKRADVRMIPISRYNELSVKFVWKFVKDIHELLEYFPGIEDSYIPDKSFMWRILGTLRNKEWVCLIEEAKVARGTQKEESTDYLIEILPEFLEKLMSVPIISKDY